MINSNYYLFYKNESIININTHINELICQTEVIQYFKNSRETAIELEMVIPQLSDINITRFEVIKKDQKIISQLLEKEKAKEKYNDTISTGNSSLISYNENDTTKICLGNLPSGEEIELKTYFFGHIICKDLSYQAKFPVIFPSFLIQGSKSEGNIENYSYNKSVVQGKININTSSKITRLIISGSNNFDKIEKKYSDDKRNIDIEICKYNFSDKDIPGIIIFRTENIYEEKLYYQYNPNKNESYYMLQKALFIPELKKELKDEIDENENIDYISLIKNNEEEKENPEICYIFLLDQSGSMSGNRIELCSKALLLFLQSLNEKSYFQLVGFGSNYEYYSEKPLEYNKENVKNLMEKIRNLKADKGCTYLYKPLENIYNNKIYEEYNMKKYIILLTDGELHDKEKVLNLIGSKSDEFIFNSLGIGECDKDLIQRTALSGKGYSYYIDDLNQLNSVVISLLDKVKEYFTINCTTTNKKPLIENDNKYTIEKYDFFNYGFILDEKDINNIEFNINIKGKEDIKISFYKNRIIRLSEGDYLGKLIVNKYLKSNIQKDTKIKIKLSKEYNILTDETAFYAKILNDTPLKEKMDKITNEDKQANNNITQSQSKSDKEEEKIDNIIRSKKYEYDKRKLQEEEKRRREEEMRRRYKECEKIGRIDNERWRHEEERRRRCEEEMRRRHEEEMRRMRCEEEMRRRNEEGMRRIDKERWRQKEKIRLINEERRRCEEKKMKCKRLDNNDNKEVKEEKNKEVKNEKLEINFDELILSQDVIEGNWENNSQVQILIINEKEIFEKIKKIAEDKGIKEENGIITLFILYYIYNKKKEKLAELKFVINKAKKYLKKLFNLDYENISKEF